MMTTGLWMNGSKPTSQSSVLLIVPLTPDRTPGWRS
jgi:hypothetical protein